MLKGPGTRESERATKRGRKSVQHVQGLVCRMLVLFISIDNSALPCNTSYCLCLKIVYRAESQGSLSENTAW